MKVIIDGSLIHLYFIYDLICNILWLIFFGQNIKNINHLIDQLIFYPQTKGQLFHVQLIKNRWLIIFNKDHADFFVPNDILTTCY